MIDEGDEVQRVLDEGEDGGIGLFAAQQNLGTLVIVQVGRDEEGGRVLLVVK